ncbi:MAG: DUF445 family protein [Defluviitaleaceae bacterium]|nr:DUF445 family protein [Defluviitaleaceae bacterium]
MEFLSMLIIPVLGAAIGYSTNLLAIAMLFRPHTEKRLFGLRLPFTPGLIPKERRQLAHKIGETFGANVLTRETLMDAAANSKIVDTVAAMAEDFVEKTAASHKTVGEMAAGWLRQDDMERAFNWLLHNKELHNIISLAADKAVIHLQSEDFARQTMDFLIKNHVPSKAAAIIKSAAANNIHRLGPAVRGLLADPRADAALRQVVAKIVKENATGLMSLFVNSDKIYNSIAEGLLEYLDNEESQAILLEKLCVFVDEFGEKELREKWLEIMINFGQNSLKKEHVAAAFSWLREQINQANLAQRTASNLLAIAPSQIFTALPDCKTHIGAAARKLTAILAQKAAEYIVGPMNIAEIVEEKINALDTKEAEKLVLSVVGKQLRWIALLGGLLGFAIGFLPMAINLVGM